MKSFKIALLLLLSIACHAAFAQQDTIGIRSILAKQTHLNESYPVEKVYLHTDKPYYATGDTIWFKAYVTIDLHQPTVLSRIVYVDLISNTDTVMASLRLPVVKGFAEGNISLDPGVFKQGNYHIRAYTNWMRNFDPSYFFSKNIPIANIDKQLSARAVFTATGKSNDAAVGRVIYKDADGNPYSNKKVSWEIETIEKTISKGRGVTDQNGVLRVSVPADKSAADADVKTLVATIDIEGKKPITNSFTVKVQNHATDVQFFPEGGQLVAGNETKVAFKAIQSNGLGVDVKGVVTDNDGKNCGTFTSQHLGMGVFSLLPESGKTYKATVTYANGAQQSYQMPAVQQSGISLMANNASADALIVRVAANQAYLDQNKGKLYYVIGKVGENVCYAAQTVLQNKIYDISISKSKLISGIVQFTLLNDHGQPLSERLAFIQNNDLLGLSVRSDKASYGKRQKVKVALVAKNQQQPVEGNFSVSVVDESKAPYDDNDETTILSHLLLTSDLQGFIEKPNYYFNHPNDKTQSDLDVLMLTQGYRRFLYTDLLAGRAPQVQFGAEQDIEITGTLRTNTGMPVSRGSVRLTVPDRNFSQNAVTDANGLFKFTNIPLLDSSKVVISAKGNYHSSTMMLMVDAATMPGLPQNYTSPNAVMNIDSTYRNYIASSKQQFHNSHMLKEVVITAKPKVKLPSHADYPALTGLSSIADHEISADRFDGCPVFINCLQTSATGLTFNDGQFYVSRDYNSGKKTPVQIFLNGTPVDVTSISGLNSSDVLSVEIFLKDELGLVNSMYNTNGVLEINTKSAALKSLPKTKLSVEDLKNMLPRNDEVTISPQGYTIARQFYTPKYDPTKQSTIGVDLRSTLYWNPQIRTDKATGAASFEFYNADGLGSHRVVVEGIDAEGHLGRAVYKYKVE